MEHTNTRESAEDYLERIYQISEDGQKEIRAIDLVNAMNFSKPSISIALRKLEEQGYVYVDEHQHIHLTETGRELALKVYERHELLGKMFVALGVDEETAYRDACKIEHDLSDATWEAIKAHYKQKVGE